jgi:hypothetical protein
MAVAVGLFMGSLILFMKVIKVATRAVVAVAILYAILYTATNFKRLKQGTRKHMTYIINIHMTVHK